MRPVSSSSGRSLRSSRQELARPAARATAVLAEIDFNQGRAQEAAARLEATLETLADEEQDEDVAIVTAQLGRFLMLAGANEEAAPYLEQALELAEAFDLPEVFVDALTSKSVLLNTEGRLEEARIILEGSIARAEAADLPDRPPGGSTTSPSSANPPTSTASAWRSSGRPSTTRIRAGDRFWEGLLRGGNVSALVLTGHWDQALRTAEELSESLESDVFSTTSCTRSRSIAGAVSPLSRARCSSDSW